MNMLRITRKPVRVNVTHDLQMHWEFGFNAYSDGAPYSDMENKAQRRGWWAASEVDDYTEAMLDNEWHARGAW